MAYLTQTQVREIIKSAPSGTTPEGIVSALRLQGHKVEGLDQPEETALPQPVKQGFSDKVKNIFNRRTEQAAEQQQRAISGEISPLRATLRTIGAGAGAVGEIAGETALTAGQAVLPKVAEEAVTNFATKVFSAEPVQSAIEKYQSFKAKHPEAAADLEALGNIATIAPVGVGTKTGVQVAGKGLVTAGKVLEESGEVAAQASRLQFLGDLVKPVQTMAVKKAQVQRTAEVGKGVFKRSVITPEPSEERAIQELVNVEGVTPQNTLQGNWNAIDDEIGRRASELERAVWKNNFVIPKREVVSRLNAVKTELAESPVIVGDAEKTAERLLNGAIKIINDNEGTGSGLLKARKEYDIWVKSQRPKAFEATTDNAFTLANRAVRNELNNILDENAKSVGVKEALRKQNALFTARDNLTPKAATEADTAIKRAWQRASEVLGTKNKAVQIVAAAAGIGGLGAAATFAPAAAVGIGTGYLIYKAGKLVLKPEVRKALGEILQKVGNALGAEEKTIIQGFISRYNDN